MKRLLTLLAAVGCFALGLAFFAKDGVDYLLRQAKDETPGCSATEPDNSDIGPDLGPVERRCRWDLRSERIGNTDYSATYGPWYYDEDWDGDRDSPRRGEPVFYRIEISGPRICGTTVQLSGSAAVWASFRRDFRLRDLPEGFLSKPGAEIVSFDKVSSVVTLHIGNERITWRVPSKPKGFARMAETAP
jgi:hypothetical protein